MSTDENRSTAFIERLGREVRRRRQTGGLTVQTLADRAGLSRRMLTQIEQGTANPSLVTVDKIAHALGIDFAALSAPSSTEPLQVSEPTEVWRNDAGSRAVLHAAGSRRGSAELWEWTLQPGDRYDAEPDPAGTEELILVTCRHPGADRRPPGSNPHPRNVRPPGQRSPLLLRRADRQNHLHPGSPARHLRHRGEWMGRGREPGECITYLGKAAGGVRG